MGDLINNVVAEARIRQAQIIAAAPKQYRKHKGSFHVKPQGGGIEREPDSNLVAQNDRNPYKDRRSRPGKRERNRQGSGTGGDGTAGNGTGGNGGTAADGNGSITGNGSTPGSASGNPAGNGGLYAGGDGRGTAGGVGTDGNDPLGTGRIPAVADPTATAPARRGRADTAPALRRGVALGTGTAGNGASGNGTSGTGTAGNGAFGTGERAAEDSAPVADRTAPASPAVPPAVGRGFTPGGGGLAAGGFGPGGAAGAGANGPGLGKPGQSGWASPAECREGPIGSANSWRQG